MKKLIFKGGTSTLAEADPEEEIVVATGDEASPLASEAGVVDQQEPEKAPTPVKYKRVDTLNEYVKEVCEEMFGEAESQKILKRVFGQDRYSNVEILLQIIVQLLGTAIENQKGK